jgi:hypothetical protein
MCVFHPAKSAAVHRPSLAAQADGTILAATARLGNLLEGNRSATTVSRVAATSDLCAARCPLAGNDEITRGLMHNARGLNPITSSFLTPSCSKLEAWRRRLQSHSMNSQLAWLKPPPDRSCAKLRSATGSSRPALPLAANEKVYYQLLTAH